MTWSAKVVIAYAREGEKMNARYASPTTQTQRLLTKGGSRMDRMLVSGECSGWSKSQTLPGHHASAGRGR